MGSHDEIDFAICFYFDHLLDEDELGPHKGDFIVHGMVYVWPELAAHLPRANRALRGWHRIYIHGEGGPQPMEIWALVAQNLKDRGEEEVRDALNLGLDAYLRSSEIFTLLAEDVSITGEGTADQVVSIRLGVAERNESTKTGMRQGVLIDWPDVADMLVTRKNQKSPKDKLFDITVDKYRKQLQRAARILNLDDLGPAHTVRHSGPSEDATTGYRTIWQIQRRGRWASEKSVLRYAKTHTLNEVKAK